MSHAPAALRRAVMVLALVLAVSACSHQEKIPKSYGDTTERNFTEGCEETLTQSSGEGEALSDDEAKSVCECSYEAISDPDTGVPFEDFKELNADQRESPTELQDALAERIETCRSEAGLS